MKIHFLFGTETGNAELVCEDIQIDLGEGFETEITSLGEFSPSDFADDTLYVCVTSTYGNGDLPVTAQPFVDSLTEDQPDLSHVQFAVFGLGDMVFAETFAQGSQALADALLARKARMIGERGLHDASSPEMPEDIAIPWMHDILAMLNRQAA